MVVMVQRGQLLNFRELARFKILDRVVEYNSSFVKQHYSCIGQCSRGRFHYLDLTVHQFCPEVRQVVEFMDFLSDIQRRDTVDVSGTNDEIHDLGRSKRVKTHGGLVEQHDAGPPDQSASNFQATLHAT